MTRFDGVSEGDFDALVVRIYRSVRSVGFEAFRDHVLNLINSVLDFDSAKWGLGIHDQDGTLISSVHLYQLPQSDIEEYTKVFKNYDAAAARMAAHIGRTVCILWDDPALSEEQTSAQCAYRLKYGIVHLLGTILPEPRLGLGHFLSLYRSDQGRPWTESARQLKERLFPHLTEAYMQARYLHIKEQGGREGAYVVSDASLSIANVTPSFREAMLREWSHWEGPRMPAEVCAVRLNGRCGFYKGKRVMISIEPDQNLVHLVVRIRNASDVLTPHERAVADLYVRGLTHDEIAKEKGVSPHTVRNQIKAVYEKLGVKNKAALVNRMEIDLS